MEIQVIKAKEQEKKRLKVAAYARVSTDHDEQEQSLDNQIRYYTDLITSKPDYDFAGIYHDFGISGFKEKRPGFQQMMKDARAGSIDLIITKSITRFARNTDTVLKATRELKEMGVGVFFELQNINTLSAEGELLMTVYAAFGQAESDSASEGAKLIYQRRLKEGRPLQALEKSFGYRLAGDGEYVPDQDAQWVVRMYEMAAAGYTCADIARFLNEQGVTTPKGKKFISSNVSRLLRSVIYKGDFIMQQTYGDESRKRQINRGELPQVYIKGDHPRIVSNKLWNAAQKKLDEREAYLNTGSVVAELTEENYPYMNQLFCAECGYKLSRRVYSDRNRLCWVCSGKKSYNSDFCEGVNIPDSVVRGWGKIKGNIYISKEIDDLGKPAFRYVSESTWLRDHKKKSPPTKAPALTLENYPYLGKIYCKKCGSALTRRVNGSGDVRWVCLGRNKNGTDYCGGVVIPDSVLRKVGDIEHNIYIGKEIIDGEERYGYTSKPDQIKG